MGKIKPIALELKSGLIIGLILIVTAAVGLLSKWKDFYNLLVPSGTILNWRFVVLLLVVSLLVLWFIMNHFWQKEFIAHQRTKKDRDNLIDELKLSENERLTDVITGIPNSRSLEKDIKEIFSLTRPGKKMQFVFIDLKSFKKINTRFGFHRTNDLLRAIAQNIYKRMRRNEDMYKYSFTDATEKAGRSGFYRVHSGGDEFAFVLEGDQADGLGFCNRLVTQFDELSRKTPQILGEEVKLSFHCAMVEIDSRDSFDDILDKTAECYKLVKDAVEDFTICWHPNTVEPSLTKDPKKKYDYDRARQLFKVLTIFNKDLS